MNFLLYEMPQSGIMEAGVIKRINVVAIMALLLVVGGCGIREGEADTSGGEAISGIPVQAAGVLASAGAAAKGAGTDTGAGTLDSAGGALY